MAHYVGAMSNEPEKKRFRPLAYLRRRRPVVALVRMAGIIAHTGGPGRLTLNLSAFEDLLDGAFALKRLKAVAVAINSPGGSPVQSALLHDRIRQLAEEKKLPVLTFCEDVAASGGYWLACAGDEIFANENSIVGSIGVIASGFGFEELIAKIGVERRLHTAGTGKSFLDPFLAERSDDIARLETLQRDVHQAFIAHVKGRRGEKLQGDEEALFSGEFWTGQKALELGLIDGLGDPRSVLKQRYGEKVKIRLMEPRKGWLQRRFNIAAPHLSAADWLDAIESKTTWQRFGL